MYNCERLINRVEGIQTAGSIQKKLKVKKSTAIKYVHLLREKGFVETKVGAGKLRVYRISRNHAVRIGNPGYYDILNNNSRIKIQEPYEHRVIGRKISVEETIAWGAAQQEIRIHISLLALFNKVKDWSKLYKYAKYFNVRRKVGALYDVAREILRVRRMDKRIRKKLKDVKGENKYLVKPMKSKDFLSIEREWNVFIDFNKKDLERYKE